MDYILVSLSQFICNNVNTMISLSTEFEKMLGEIKKMICNG